MTVILLAENFRIKKLGAEVKILNLNNYLTICCQNNKDTMVTHQRGSK
jgi:hypothetical protein